MLNKVSLYLLHFNYHNHAGSILLQKCDVFSRFFCCRKHASRVIVFVILTEDCRCSTHLSDASKLKLKCDYPLTQTISVQIPSDPLSIPSNMLIVEPRKKIPIVAPRLLNTVVLLQSPHDQPIPDLRVEYSLLLCWHFF